MKKIKKAPPKIKLGREKALDLLTNGNFKNEDRQIKINYQNDKNHSYE